LQAMTWRQGINAEFSSGKLLQAYDTETRNPYRISIWKTPARWTMNWEEDSNILVYFREKFVRKVGRCRLIRFSPNSSLGSGTW
jgi:hypothetical protein